MFAMFGATILVPLLSGLSVQVTLVGVGVGTLIFYFFGVVLNAILPDKEPVQAVK